METKKQSLPQLPPRLKAETLASADNLTAIAHSEDVQLGGKNGEAFPLLPFFTQSANDAFKPSLNRNLTWVTS